MTPEQWRYVNQIFDHAVDLPPAAQLAAVHELSKGEAVVEAEVLRLLQSMRQAGDFLAAPLLDLHALLPDELPPAPIFVPGAVILERFHIRRFLASGGMGEVYEAWDNELDEAVALKTIRPQIARHPEVIERFKQEVRNARGISHPNICRVYEIFYVAEPGGERIWFLSMEMVHGTTLLDCIRTKGCLPSADALLIARQMASGLEAAHQYGLVHRDFKSANVMLVEEDAKPARAVIMDFGLSARMLQSGDTDRHATAGTPGYMAPEQERGGAIGPLADQYAFGVVLCEMLSGALPTWKPAKPEGRRRSTFRGLIRPRQIAFPTNAEAHENRRAAAGLQAQGDVAVLANGAAEGKVAIQEVVAANSDLAGQVKTTQVEKPRLRLPPHRFSPRAEHVIRRCLDRDPACRFPDMKTAANTLVPPSVLGTPWRKAIAACLIVLLGLGAWRWNVWRHRCLICDVVQLTPDTDQSDDPSLSADGKLISYSSDRGSTGNLDIFIQALPSGPAVRLTRDPARDTEPSLSPDGSQVAFRSERSPAGIYLMSTYGGEQHLLIPDGRSPRFSPDGKSLLYWTGDMNPAMATGHMYYFDLASNSSRQIAANFQDARYPVWSPDGRRILFTGCAIEGRSPNGCSDWWVWTLDGGRPVQTHAVEKLRLHGVFLYRLVTGAWIDDDIIFSGLAGSKRNLWKLKLSHGDWQVRGEPELLLAQSTTDLNPTIAVGDIAYTSVSGSLHIWKLRQQREMNPQEPEKVTDDAEIDSTPFVSENGRFLIFERGRTRRNLVVRDNLTSTESTVLESPSAATWPIIDSTGTWIAYEEQDSYGTSIRFGHPSEPSRLLCRDCIEPSGWFAGNHGFFVRKGSPSSIFLADPQTGTLQEVVSSKGRSIGSANWSPISHFLLFTVTMGNTSRIVATRLENDRGSGADMWINVTDAASDARHPCWSSDARSIYYVSDYGGSQTIVRQAFSPEKSQIVGKPVPLTTLHDDRRSIDNVTRTSFKLSAGGNGLYLNLGEPTSTIQLGRQSTAEFFPHRH